MNSLPIYLSDEITPMENIIYSKGKSYRINVLTSVSISAERSVSIEVVQAMIITVKSTF